MSRVGSGLRRFERRWLGLRSVPFRVEADEAGWTPDRAGDACWRCGTSVGIGEADGDGCATCRLRRVPWDRFVRVGSYEGVLRRAVLELKFQRFRRRGRELGAMLGDAVACDAEREGLDPTELVFAAVPMAFGRRMARGVDHAELLARAAAEQCGGSFARGVLQRQGRRPQVGLAPGRRAANVRGSMRARDGALSGRVLVVVDDVRTTGATLGEACRAVRDAGGLGSDALLWAAAAGVTPTADRGGRRDLGGLVGVPRAGDRP